MVETLGMIVAEPGRWLVAVGQKGFSMTSAGALRRHEMIESRKGSGARREWFPTEAGIKAAEKVS